MMSFSWWPRSFWLSSQALLFETAARKRGFRRRQLQRDERTLHVAGVRCVGVLGSRACWWSPRARRCSTDAAGASNLGRAVRCRRWWSVVGHAALPVVDGVAVAVQGPDRAVLSVISVIAHGHQRGRRSGPASPAVAREVT
jgi:hypothetical protein